LSIATLMGERSLTPQRFNPHALSAESRLSAAGHTASTAAQARWFHVGTPVWLT